MAGANLVQEDEILGKAYDARLMRRIIAYVKPYKLQVLIAFVLIFATAAVDLITPYLTGYAIDHAITPKRPDLLAPIVAVFIGSLVASFILRYAQNYIMQVIGQGVMYDIRYQIFSHLQNQSLSYFDRNPVGRLISRLTNDV